MGDSGISSSFVYFHSSHSCKCPMEDCFVKEFGLLFDKRVADGGQTLSILTVGDSDCGKAELIKTFFGPLPDNVYSDYPNHEQYYFHLDFQKNMSLPLIIFDAKNSTFLKMGNFVQNTAILHCFDVDNPKSLKNIEEVWIPIILKTGLSALRHFIVCIEREDSQRESEDAVPPKRTKISATDRDESRKKLLDEAEKLSKQYSVPSPLKCPLSDKNAMLKVFQTAVNAVFPRRP